MEEEEEEEEEKKEEKEEEEKKEEEEEESVISFSVRFLQRVVARLSRSGHGCIGFLQSNHSVKVEPFSHSYITSHLFTSHHIFILSR